MTHNALGDQFADHVNVYRGLNEVAPGEINHSSLGSHWSHDPNVAYDFALGRPSGYPDEMSEGDDKGTVLSGLVHRDHIIEPGTPEHEEWMDHSSVFGEGHPEMEATVRPGSPVYITSMSHVTMTPEGHESEEHTRFSPFREHRA